MGLNYDEHIKILTLLGYNNDILEAETSILADIYNKETKVLNGENTENK